MPSLHKCFISGLLLLSAGGCAREGATVRAASAVGETGNWRTVATDADERRLYRWREAFVAALAEARQSGHAREVAREGVLLTPDAALPNGDLPEGAYRCRTIKLGSQSGSGGLAYTAYQPFECQVTREGRLKAFFKLTGSQRPQGLIFPGDARREIFIGTMVLGDEREAIEYGRDADRDMAGAVERIGERRWRLLLPYPRFESVLDVIELVPAS